MSEVNNDVLRPVLVYSSIMPAAYIIIIIYYESGWDGYWVSIIWIMRWIQIVKIVEEILVPGVFLIVDDRFLHTW